MLSAANSVPGLLRQSAAATPTTSSTDLDKQSQLHALLESHGKPEVPSLLKEVGLISLVPVVLWCVASWALSYVGEVHLLAKFQLFAFLPAAASAYACERIRQLRCLPSQLTWLKDENEWFKNSNAELKSGVDLLRAENEETRAQNQNLEASIASLESVRTAIETYANRHETDFGQVLSDFQRTVAEQKEMLQRARQIQKRTRKLTEAQWRSLMLNLYAQVEYTDGQRGMNRREFDLWLAMLPREIAVKLGPETFESIDCNGDGVIDVKEMCNWVQGAVSTLLTSPEDLEDDDSGPEGAHESKDAFEAVGAVAGAAGSVERTGGILAQRRVHGTADNTSASSPRESLPQARSNCRDVKLRPNRESPRSQEAGSKGGGILGGFLASEDLSSPLHRESSNRELRVPTRKERGRPAFNDQYMKMLFGGVAAPSPTTTGLLAGSSFDSASAASLSRGQCQSRGSSLEAGLSRGR